MLLNHKKCLNFQPRSKSYRERDGNGLYLQVEPNGSKLWRYRYQFHGKAKQLALGPFPEIGLADARDLLMHARKLLREGSDPSAQRKQRRQLLKEFPLDTFREFALDWHQRGAKTWCKRHAFNINSRLVHDVFPVFGDVSIDQIRPSHLVDLIDRINARGAYDIARRTLAYCSQVFDYAISRDKLTINPALGRKRNLIRPVTKHFASISHNEIPELLGKLNHYASPILPQTRLATLLLMLTFVRTKELTEAVWTEFDFDIRRWIIPAARMKKRRDHIVPLSRQAIEILRMLKTLAGNSPYILPSRSRLHRPMSNCTILNGLKRIGYKGTMTGHGFRSLAATTLRENLREQRDVIDLQLAHKPINKSNPYDRSTFLEERTELMQKWADYIDSVNPVLCDHEASTPAPIAQEGVRSMV